MKFTVLVGLLSTIVTVYAITLPVGIKPLAKNESNDRYIIKFIIQSDLYIF